jgi:mannosyltransferase
MLHSGAMNQRAHPRLLLFGIVLLSLALRLFHLGIESLWYDETVSVYLAGQPALELIRHTAGDIHPPGYYLLLRGWLIVMGFGDGRADAAGHVLETSAAFFSVMFGILLIPLTYVVARRVASARVALVAALLAGIAPFAVWYSQEVRMYTMGAVLLTLGLYAAFRIVQSAPDSPKKLISWSVLYAVCAAGALYTLYYAAFFLLALGAMGVLYTLGRRSTMGAWVGANFAALFLYAPWIPTALRQAFNPPVPGWRTPVGLSQALAESIRVLAFGQSLPPGFWLALLLVIPLYVFGAMCLWRRNSLGSVFIVGATFGPILLILALSVFTPLYNVRYLFLYACPVSIVIASAMVHIPKTIGGGRFIAPAIGFLWCCLSGYSLWHLWTVDSLAVDDHRGAVRELQARWRPGDAIVVNAGYVYTALHTYWQGSYPWQGRLGAAPPSATDAPLIYTTGSLDGPSSLGWGDPHSDFFSIARSDAERALGALLSTHVRVWQYRIYDTVTDPNSYLRGLLEQRSVRFYERTFNGEAYLKVQGLIVPGGIHDQPTWPEAYVARSFAVRAAPVVATANAGEKIYVKLIWNRISAVPAGLGVSIRLLDEGGQTRSQPPDDQPVGPLFRANDWQPGQWQPQTLALPIPPETPPGTYRLRIIAYDPETAQPYQVFAQGTDTHWDIGTVLVTSQRSS